MHILGNFGPGGAEMGVVRLIRDFPDDKVQHSVCSIGSNHCMKDFLPKGACFYSLGIHGANYFAFLPLYKLFKRTAVDIAHVNNLAPWFDVAIASRLAGCQCIETFHGVEAKSERFSLRRRILFRLAARLSASMTAVSGPAAELMARFIKIDNAKIKIIPNGVDTGQFKPRDSKELRLSLRRELELPEESLLFGCIAALRPVKNHAGLLRAFAKALSLNEGRGDLHNAYLVLVGDGSLRDELKRLVCELGLSDRVIFMGHRNDVQRILQVLDAFVLNSYTEGMSYAVLEAMSSGLPIIATDVGANSELIENNREGFLVTPDNVDSMAKALASAIKNRGILWRLGQNAREKVMRYYSLGSMLGSYDKLYKEVAL